MARIRDLVTIESRGQVRFVQGGPEGALPYAPWFGEVNPRAEQMNRARPLGEVRGVKGSSLERMSIVVADDDAAITWFLAGVLRSAGATVHEARDGERAFELACEHSPDLVISDIVMPGMDGFALCRAIKRDFALRDVPVVLLSWKEDLLQRVRELGAGADGYMRKEASASAIVQRLREILAARLRVVERLARGGEVRGRLEGLTPRTLLSLACQHLPASTLSVRDARDLYEVEIRDGRPMRATRTTADGSYERGPGVLARLLGVGSGRFVVVPIAGDDVERLSAARPDLFGTLSEQLVPLVASARAAQRLLSGASLMQATRIELDMGILRPLAEVMPDRARSVIKAIADGSSARDLVMSGSAPARLVEDVLCDAAAHGAISAIVGASGTDLLTPAVQIESDRLRGVRRLAPVLVPPLSDVLPEPEAVSPSPQPVSAVIDRSVTPAPVVRDELSARAPIVETNAKKTRVSLVDDKPRETMRAAQTPAVLVAPNDDDDDATTLALMDKSPVANVAVEQAEDFTPDIISGVQTYLPPPVAPVGQVEAASAKPSLAKETPKETAKEAAKETAKEAVKGKSQPIAKATFRDTPILGSKVSLKLPVPEPEHDLGQETIKDNLEVAPEFTESPKVAVVPTQRASILPPPPPQTRAPLEALTPSRKPMEVTPGMSSPIAAKLSTPASPKPVVAKPVSPKPVAVKPNSPKPPIVAKPKPAPLSSLGSLEPPPVEDLSPLRVTLPSTHAPRPRVSEATVARE